MTKFRGSDFRGGYHDYRIRRGGLDVYPRLSPRSTGSRLAVSASRAVSLQLDTLLGGGLERGTSTLILGAAGTGKSTLASLFAASTAAHGGRAALFIFDESANTLFSRTEGLNIPLKEHVDAGRVRVRQIDPAELSPGELAQLIRSAVEIDGVQLVVIDSLNGYLNAMPDEKFLVVQLHEILTYLGQAGVATILVAAHQGMIGAHMSTPVDASYLADAVVLLRYFEAEGEVRQAISVVKKRGGEHERSIREFSMKTGASPSASRCAISAASSPACRRRRQGRERAAGSGSRAPAAHPGAGREGCIAHCDGAGQGGALMRQLPRPGAARARARAGRGRRRDCRGGARGARRSARDVARPTAPVVGPPDPAAYACRGRFAGRG